MQPGYQQNPKNVSANVTNQTESLNTTNEHATLTNVIRRKTPIYFLNN